MSDVCLNTVAIGIVDEPVLKTVDITFADSPFQAKRVHDVIRADATDGEIIILLYPKKNGKLLRIKRKNTGFKVKYQGNGSDEIDGLAERELAGQYNSDTIIGERLEWGRY